jgi:hypothetical protein
MVNLSTVSTTDEEIRARFSPRIFCFPFLFRFFSSYLSFSLSDRCIKNKQVNKQQKQDVQILPTNK